MIDDALLAKFNRIEDLPVSEEMLGAYLEDNLSPSEIDDVELALLDNDYLGDLANSVLEYDTDIDSISTGSVLDDFVLPNINEDSFLDLDLAYSSPFPGSEDFDCVAACAIDNEYSHIDSYDDDNIDNPFEDEDSPFDSSDDNNISDYE